MEYSQARTSGTCLSSANNALEAVCAVEEWSGEERTVKGEVTVDKTKGGSIPGRGGAWNPEKAEKRGQKGEGGGGPGKGQTE